MRAYNYPEISAKLLTPEIMQQCPDVSQTSIQRALNDLVKSGEV